MSGFVHFDPGCKIVLEDADQRGKFLLVTGEDGTRVRVALTAEMLRMMGYHGALAYREMTGEACLMCPGITVELPAFEPPPDPLGKWSAPKDTYEDAMEAADKLFERAEAARPRMRTRTAPPPAPVLPTPRVRTRRGPPL